VFIYTNAHILDEYDTPPSSGARVDFNAKPLDSLTQEEEVRLEDILLDLEEEDEGVSIGQNVFTNGYDEESFSLDEE